MSCRNIVREVSDVIVQGSLVDIKRLLGPYSLEERRRIISQNIDGSSLLYTAVTNESLSIIIYLLDYCEADVNSVGIKSGCKSTCLSEAAAIDSLSAVNILLLRGANPEAVSDNQTTALFKACFHNRLSIIKRLVKSGANINAQSSCGLSCLMVAIRNIQLCTFLEFKGINVNLVNTEGKTALMMAIEGRKRDVVFFLLNCKKIDIRFTNELQENALGLAARYSSQKIIKEIITKGSYTKEEVISVFELECCFSRIERNERKFRRFLKNVLELRALPNDTPMFGNHHSSEKLRKVLPYFSYSDGSVIIFLESVYGLSHIFTLRAYTTAVCNVRDIDKHFEFCTFLFDLLRSADNHLFFQAYEEVKRIIGYYFPLRSSNNESKMSQVFEMFVEYVEQFRARLKKMKPEEKIRHTHKEDSYLYFFFNLLKLIHERLPQKMELFHQGIKRILKADFRGFNNESFLETCVTKNYPLDILDTVLFCEANIYSTNNEGKTALHQIVDKVRFRKMPMTEKIIAKGFDFRRIINDGHCLPCRLQKERILPKPLKYVSLQCLAARVICENGIGYISHLPDDVQTAINSHF